jgi:thioredoxin
LINKTKILKVTKQKAKMAKVEFLNEETFKQKVFNYEENKEWKYEGDIPCMIDFYADWCQPCKMVAPILDELAEEYDGKIYIYKIDTEAERNLAGMFGIQSIPSLLFVPVEGQPQMAVGALPKETFKKAIADVLKVEVPA